MKRATLGCRLLYVSVIVLVLLCGGMRARADYREMYIEGLKARDGRRWGEVVEKMSAAIAEQPEEGQTIRSGDLVEVYYPFYYLGEAHAKLRNCRAAAAAWGQAAKQGVLRRNALLYVRLRKGIDACATKAPMAGDARPRRPYVQGVHPQLVEAAAALGDGNYEHVRHVLRDVSFADTRMAAQRHLLLAAADYTLFILAGNGESALYESAVDHVRRCRRVDYSITPGRGTFSPRFIDFFRQVR